MFSEFFYKRDAISFEGELQSHAYFISDIKTKRDSPKSQSSTYHHHSGHHMDNGVSVKQVGDKKQRVTVNSNPNFGKNMQLTYSEWANMGIKSAREYDIWLAGQWAAGKMVDKGKSIARDQR